MSSTALSIVVFLLFVGSGAAALIYEIVWQQLLQLVIGSSTVSLGVLLGTFMGGMCLGSLYAPRLISPRRHPLRVYAVLELAIGAIGLLLLAGMPLVARMYFAWGGAGAFGLLLRAFVAALCLLPPTLLMGATLPAVARSVEATPSGTSWLGVFYAGNIAGAVFGCLLAGFYESSPAAVKSEVATFFGAFPNGLIFGNTFDGRAIDTVLVGQAETPEIYIEDVDDALRLPSFAKVALSLGEIGLYGAQELFGNYAGRARDLKSWMADAEINRDRNLRLQYLAGFGVNQHVGNDIYQDMLAYRIFPDDVFYGSSEALRRLRLQIEDTRE